MTVKKLLILFFAKKFWNLDQYLKIFINWLFHNKLVVYINLEAITLIGKVISLKHIEIVISRKNAKLPIIDTLTTWGYIFSLVISNVKMQTMTNYFLLLFTIYPKYFYSAYICNKLIKQILKQILFMNCVIYVAPKNTAPEQLIFFIQSL